jgi:hypothetical protein
MEPGRIPAKLSPADVDDVCARPRLHAALDHARRRRVVWVNPPHRPRAAVRKFPLVVRADRCTPTDLVNRIARVPRSPRDQPIAPVTIRRVSVRR